MAPGCRGKRRAAPRSLPGFSRRAFRWPRRPQGKPPAAAKAWPSFATGPAPPAFHRGPRSNAKRPRFWPLPARTARSTACGTRPASRAPRQGAATRESLSRAPDARSTLPWRPAACFVLPICLIVFYHRRHQMRGEVLCEPVERRVLFLEKVLQGGQIGLAGTVGRAGCDLILIAEDKIVRMIEDFLSRALREGHFTLYRDKHGRRAACRGVKQKWHRFQTQDLASQNRVGVFRIRHHLVGRLCQKLVYGRRRQLLLQPITGGLILQRRNRDHVDTLGQRRAVPCDVIAAAGNQ